MSEEIKMAEEIKKLEKSIEIVLQKAQLLLKRDDVQDLLSKEPKQSHFWSSFFQVILSRSFGPITPGIEKWLFLAEELRKIHDTELLDPEEPDSGLYSNSLFTVAQFWNADDYRATAFLVRDNSDKVSERNTSPQFLGETYLEEQDNWYQRWELMNAINKLGKHGDKDPLLPRNIGNFIVRRSQEDKGACPSFQLHVVENVKSLNYNRFLNILKSMKSWPLSGINSQEFIDFIKILKKQNDYKSIKFEYLEVPQTIANKVVDKLSELRKEDIATEASLIFELKHNIDLWDNEELNSYMLYMAIYVHSNYYGKLNIDDLKNLKSVPSNEQLRLILLNNLRIVHPLMPGDQNISLHYQYCIPVWNKSASYLFIVTQNELSEDEFKRISNFAERLFGLSWVYDSLRSLEQKRKEFVRQAAKAARAAILARNFSHTVGSHVLNSPSFAVTISQGVDHHEIVNQFTDLRIFLENLDRNVALDNLDQHIGTVKHALTQFENGIQSTKDFFKFLQGRFDFIARAIEDYGPPVEPVFFIREVLNGFIEQTAFLDHLVKDLGWSAREMKFRIFLPNHDNIYKTKGGSEFVEFFRSVRTSSDWDTTEMNLETGLKIDKGAVLIGFPGGVTGAQAFYSILENIIRNSFKYGNNKKDDYELFIKISRIEKDNSYKLYIWDNFSVSGNIYDDKSTISKIGKILEEPLIDESSGELIPNGLGIKEMRICASHLSPKNERPLELIPPNKLREICKEAYIKDVGLELQPLVYKKTLETPILLAILSKKDIPNNNVGWIRRVHLLDEIANSGVQIALIPAELVNEKLLEDFCEKQISLPYRTFVIVNKEDQLEKIRKMIEQSDIPDRRLLCYLDKTGQISHIINEEVPQDMSKGGDWIILAYEAWLCAWKGNPPGGKWHLWIGFERNEDIVENTWGKVIKNYKSDLITIIVRTNDENKQRTWTSESDESYKKIFEPEEKYWSTELSQAIENKKALVFDNHANCFEVLDAEKNPDLLKGTRYYQQTGGQSSFALFQRLNTPPKDLFGFNFFILGLVESCLSNIAIIDERIASKALELDAPNKFTQSLSTFHKIGIYPLFQIGLNQYGNSYYSTKHKDALIAEFNRGNKVKLLQEGLQWFDVEKKFIIRELIFRNSGQELGLEQIQLDALILHEGVFDVLNLNPETEWNTKMTKILYKSIPSIIRTSGRGHHSPNIGDWTPFLEATILSSSLITSIDKYNLNRTVFSLTGNK